MACGVVAIADVPGTCAVAVPETAVGGLTATGTPFAVAFGAGFGAEFGAMAALPWPASLLAGDGKNVALWPE